MGNTSEHKTVTDLEELVAALPEEEQHRFHRLFMVSTTVGRLMPPPEMISWIEQQFGNLDAVKDQRIVNVMNRVTLEGTLFNTLRAGRPMVGQQNGNLASILDAGRASDPFANPLTDTAADTFGRIRGKHCLTASNAAKYDGLHGLLIFDEYQPLEFNAEQLADYLDTARRWFQAAHEEDPAAQYPILLWNCLWKSGASVMHGHMHMLLGHHPYAKVENLRRSSAQYGQDTGNNYFNDLFLVHRALGLQVKLGEGVAIVAYLTPIKEREVILRGDRLDTNLAMALYHVLACYRNLGVTSFNVAAYLPPLSPVDNEEWIHFPVFLRVVDRGDLFHNTADIGAMELYAQSVVSSDPFQLAYDLAVTRI